MYDCLAASLLAWILRKPHLIHLHYPMGVWLGQLVNWRLRHCARAVVLSEFMRRDTIRHGVSPGRITVIPGTISIPAPSRDAREAVLTELNIPVQDTIVVGIAARLERWKGQADTIAAFSRACGASSSVHLLVIGEGDARTGLEQLARRCPAAGRIHFLGFRSDMGRLLGALDVFVHPSLQEAFGMSVLEASAAGLPVIAYDDGASSELVVHGFTGLLAPTGDVERLSDYLKCLTRTRRDESYWGRQGANARVGCSHPLPPAFPTQQRYEISSAGRAARTQAVITTASVEGEWVGGETSRSDG